MWLCDLTEAIKDMWELFPDGCVMEKVYPSGSGICFCLTDFSKVLCMNDGSVIRVDQFHNIEKLK